jgi:hypothetical protein
MSKESGLGDNFYIDGHNLSGDINSLGSISCPLATEERTGIDKFAVERGGLLHDGAMEWVAYFNPSTGQAHPKLSALPTADVVASYWRGTTLGNPVASLVGKQLNYDGNRGDNGSLRMNAQAQANAYGLDWGRSLTAGVRTDTGATNGTSIDTTASVSFGAQAYLHVFAFTGTSAVVKIQDSADNSTFADVTGLTFTTVTSAPFSQRLATSRTATIRRYIRAVTTTAASFSNLQFAVQINKNKVLSDVS